MSFKADSCPIGLFRLSAPYYDPQSLLFAAFEAEDMSGLEGVIGSYAEAYRADICGRRLQAHLFDVHTVVNRRRNLYHPFGLLPLMLSSFFHAPFLPRIFNYRGARNGNC